MANSFFTSDRLIKSIKRRGTIPTSQNLFSDEDFLELANEEMEMGVIPAILSHHEDYFLFEERQSLVPGKDRYRLPERAIGNKLRDVAFIDQQGNYYEMTRIGKGEISDYNSGYVSDANYVFYVENNEVVLLPTALNTTSETGFVAMSYYMRPNQLVEEAKGARISAVDFNRGRITLTSTPTAFTTTDDLGQSQVFDFISHISPHKTISFDKSAFSITSSTNNMIFGTYDIFNITFPAESSIADGSYIQITNSVDKIDYVLWFDINNDSLGQPNIVSGNTVQYYRIAGTGGTLNSSQVAALFQTAINTNLSGIFTVAVNANIITIQDARFVGNILTLFSFDSDITFTQTTTGTKVLDEDELIVGDFVTIANETIVPQIPSDLHSMLAQRVVTRVMEALKDSQGLQNSNNKLAEMENKLGNLIQDRVEDAPQKVKQRHGFLNFSRRYRGRNY